MSDLKILFILGGLKIGGVETYITRLANELTIKGNSVDILLLSEKVDAELILNVSTYAKVSVFDRTRFFTASSWINAFLPFTPNTKQLNYDLVHVVDLLTLGFVFLNQNSIKFTNLSIGIYHQMEINWWRDKKIYFRRKLIELYDKNIKLTLFPNEFTAQLGANLTSTSINELKILPLGINLSKYANCKPLRDSLKIVSIGRLVDFKVYNKHLISQFAEIRKLGNFEYYIYGEGPEKESLRTLAIKEGVSDYVHFMGQINYDDMPQVLNNSFCFVGSGTAIIEAAAAGIPSIVGIESIKNPQTCGFFCDVIGYSYNEELASSNRITFYEIIQSLYLLSSNAYVAISDKHRRKSRDFDLRITATKFLEMSSDRPDFNFSFNRWLALMSFFYSIISLGKKALKNRFDR
jgi:glycosyltransferase involved in cell wall biosynthesis